MLGAAAAAYRRLLGEVMKPEDGVRCRFEHYALFYEGSEEYRDGTRQFIEAGLALRERVLVSVPGAKIESTRAMLDGGADRVEFWDMNELGRNPGRIIPAVRDWVERGEGRCRFIGEPIWPGRSATEVVEATRHEALINLAFADADATILCPYDTTGLDPDGAADAERTHPRSDPLRPGPLQVGATPTRSRCGRGRLGRCRPRRCRDACIGRPRSSRDSRRSPREQARAAGLGEERAAGSGAGRRRGRDECARPRERRRRWSGSGAMAHEMICEVADQGCLTEPLAGRRRPVPDWQMDGACG